MTTDPLAGLPGAGWFPHYVGYPGERGAGAVVVVVSLGVDAARDDPESPLRVTAAGYRRAGELIGALGPVVAVQEGGYHLPTLGPLVVAALAGLAGAAQ